jgi:hypothetical protein
LAGKKRQGGVSVLNKFDPDRVRRLEERAERDYPESIILENQDDHFTGVFQRLEKGSTRYGDRYIAILEDSNAVEHSLWLTHTALASQFDAKRPKAGELCTIYRGGKKISGGGNEYVNWRLEIDREVDSEPDWGSVAQTVAAEEDSGAFEF